MKPLKEQLICENSTLSLNLSEKEAEWLLGSLLDSYEVADSKNFWNNGSIFNKKQAKQFFEKLYDVMDKQYEFVKAHSWYRDLEKNF